MNQDTKKKLLGKLIIIGVLLFFLVILFFIQYYFTHERNECLSNPLIYGAKQLKNEIGYEFIGTGYFLTPTNLQSPIVTFNSSSMITKTP